MTWSETAPRTRAAGLRARTGRTSRRRTTRGASVGRGGARRGPAGAPPRSAAAAAGGGRGTDGGRASKRGRGGGRGAEGTGTASSRAPRARRHRRHRRRDPLTPRRGRPRRTTYTLRADTLPTSETLAAAPGVGGGIRSVLGTGFAKWGRGGKKGQGCFGVEVKDFIRVQSQP